VAGSFKFLSMEAFERLGSSDKLTYLSDAMEELQRLKVPRELRGWHSLFTQEQQQLPQPKDDTKSD
jgi:Zn-finger domain-containing protein